MNSRFRFIAAAAVALALPASGRGQSIPATVLRPAASHEIPENVFVGTSTGPANGAEKTSIPDTAEARKAERLQKVQQLGFDRRPSTVLKGWAGRDEIKGKENEPAKPKPDPFDLEIKAFQHLVTTGDWSGVKVFLARRPEDEGKALYAKLIEALPNPPQDNAQPGGVSQQMQMQMQMLQQNPQLAAYMEKNTITNADVIGIAAAAPGKLERENLEGLGHLLRASIDRGNAVDDFLARVRTGLKGQEQAKAFPLTRREVARLLVAADCSIEAGAFLPTPEKAEKDDDREALNLLSRHFAALYAKEKKAAHLENAWKVTQAVLAVGKVDREEKDEALTRAVEMAVQVRAALGRAWLEESFTSRPERGMEIIAAIGSEASRGFQTHPNDSDYRKKSLDLQKTAVEALLRAAAGRAAGWSQKLGLLASAWLAEAEFSNQFDDSTGLGPQMQRDPYGNLFFVNNGGSGYNPNMIRAVAVADVLESRPGEGWANLLGPALRPRFAAACSQLYLKVGEEDLAFPYIERLAPTHPAKAKELADEFVRVWTRNHDPNAERNRTNPYMYMFGFERKAESIPLTRSKQERNLRELSAWVKRLRTLPGVVVDETLIAAAFTTCHSVAEVYRVEAIDSVFGSIDALKPETLAALVQQMRGNLMGLWRQPAVQEQSKTRRKEKDIRAEVFRGYAVARSVVALGLKKYPGNWEIALAEAALKHDENNYRQEIEPGLGYSKARREALAGFARAASLYAKAVPALSEDDETARPYEQWFYASLGASDLGAIDEKSVADTSQPAAIRAAIGALPGASAGRHMAKFANDLFTRMSGLNPAVKFRYLRGGFEIVGDNKHAHEARKVYDYYKDLVTEIRLDAAVDGDSTVGHGRAFGVLVSLRHTREIERESGGFGRYLQNQNQGNGMFMYNFGRPLENYRDKFQDAATKALREHFEVLSVTFEDDKVNSRATAEDGWRVTPYAYLLLKARGPEVDKVPPLRLDFDFLDTSGYVILPVESPVVPIDAAPAAPPPRPFGKLTVTQTLDERQAKDGKLILEVKAVAQGLVPEFDQVLDLNTPGFRAEKADDQGLSVSRFDPESDAATVLSDRSWLITLRAVEGMPKPAESFRFATAKVDGADMSYQRYDDADLTRVTPVVALGERYGRPSRAWVGWYAGGAAVVVGVLVLASRLFRRRPKRVRVERFRMPNPVTPFTVLGLLRDIERNNGLNESSKRELAASIGRLETHFFDEPSAEAPDLHAIASDWLHKAGV